MQLFVVRAPRKLSNGKRQNGMWRGYDWRLGYSGPYSRQKAKQVAQGTGGNVHSLGSVGGDFLDDALGRLEERISGEDLFENENDSENADSEDADSEDADSEEESAEEESLLTENDAGPAAEEGPAGEVVLPSEDEDVDVPGGEEEFEENREEAEERLRKEKEDSENDTGEDGTGEQEEDPGQDHDLPSEEEGVDVPDGDEVEVYPPASELSYQEKTRVMKEADFDWMSHAESRKSEEVTRVYEEEFLASRSL